MIVSIWSAYLRRHGRILSLVALALALLVQGAWAQKTVRAPAYEGTNAVGPNFVADATSGPPLQVSSTSQVNNFNADFLNGFHASAFAKLGTANIFSADQTFTSRVSVGFSG